MLSFRRSVRLCTAVLFVIRDRAHVLCRVVFHGLRHFRGQVVYLPRAQELRGKEGGVGRRPKRPQVGSCQSARTRIQRSSTRVNPAHAHCESPYTLTEKTPNHRSKCHRPITPQLQFKDNSRQRNFNVPFSKTLFHCKTIGTHRAVAQRNGLSS